MKDKNFRARKALSIARRMIVPGHMIKIPKVLKVREKDAVGLAAPQQKEKAKAATSRDGPHTIGGINKEHNTAWAAEQGAPIGEMQRHGQRHHGGQGRNGSIDIGIADACPRCMAWNEFQVSQRLCTL